MQRAIRTIALALLVTLALVSSACGSNPSAEPTAATASGSTTPRASLTTPTTLASAPTTTATAPTTTALPTTTTTTPLYGRLSPDLRAAAESTRGTECVTFRPTQELLGTLMGADLEVDNQGVAWDVSAGTQTPFTTSEGTVRNVHVLLQANIHRVEYALGAFVGTGREPLIVYDDPFAIGDDDAVVATWTGQYIQIGEGEPVEFPVYSMLRQLDPLKALQPGTHNAAWEVVDEWLDEVRSITDRITVEGLVDLEPLAVELDVIEMLTCAILAGEFVAADEAIGGRDSDIQWMLDNQHVLFEELAAQEVLLATELLRALVEHMNDPGVDWLRGPDVDLVDAMDGTTSTSEYLFYWHSSLRLILNNIDWWRNPTE